MTDHRKLTEEERRHKAQALLVESLAGSPETEFSDVVKGMIWFGLPLLGFGCLAWLGWRPRNAELVLAAAIAAGIGLLVLSLTVGERLLSAWRSRQLRRLGHGFEAGPYLAALSEQRDEGRLVVELRFERPWPADAQAKTQGEVERWAPGVHATWVDERSLRLESKPISGTGSVTSHGTTVRFFTNRRVHDCFARIATKVVPRLEAASPVAFVRVEIKGPVVPLDESP